MNESTDPISLTDFLLARIAEDEAAARDANYWADLMAALGGGPNARHGARHNPARVLAECEAKRRIVELRYSWNLQAERESAPPLGPILKAQVITADTVLRILAQPYADHSDYREEWKS